LSDKPITWITGAGGLIGHNLARTAPVYAPGREVVALTRAQFDLVDFDAVRREFRRQSPRLIIHCAALSRSPACEADPSLARRVNVETTKVLADLAAEIAFFFFSSDLVFDGTAGNYDEQAAVNPLSVYGETKVAAERIVLENPNHTVIRTSLNSGVSPSGDRSLDEQVRKAWQAGQTLRFFVDEFRCPIPAEVTARAVWELAAWHRSGLYHVAGSERLSRWQIGQALAARWPDLRSKMQSASICEAVGAPRPPDTSLNCEKVQKVLSFPLPRWGQWVSEQAQGGQGL
jgi:dTDP-4-dehydrorhamnose reductase